MVDSLLIKAVRRATNELNLLHALWSDILRDAHEVDPAVAGGGKRAVKQRLPAEKRLPGHFAKLRPTGWQLWDKSLLFNTGYRLAEAVVGIRYVSPPTYACFLFRADISNPLGTTVCRRILQPVCRIQPFARTGI
jgi:hypothetical protein